jgi:hypothetical protein
MRKRSNKRASLELSVNAIVVIVLAIAMLGLGIAFTKNMFSNLGDKLLDIQPPDQKASQADPLVFNDPVKITHAKPGGFASSYFNNCVAATVTPSILCTPALGQAAGPGVMVSEGTETIFKFTFDKNNANVKAIGTNSICTVTITNGACTMSKQVTVVVI